MGVGGQAVQVGMGKLNGCGWVGHIGIGWAGCIGLMSRLNGGGWVC